MHEKRIHQVFVVSVLAKGAHALLEIAGGLALYLFSADAIALLAAQAWRGNIRELRNVLEQAAMRRDSQHIDVRAIEEVLR